MNILLSLIAFLIGFGAVAAYQYYKTQLPPPIVQTGLVTITPEPTFALVPPQQAISGTLTVLSGHAKKFSRNDTEYKEASTGAQILLGESIATEENSSATASVSGIVNVSLGPSAELVFANVFPSNIVLQQRAGKITYTVTNPVSVRLLHTLATLNPGVVTITIIDTDTSITVTKGSVKFALVDNDNKTNVWNLDEGKRANIDDQAREVTLVQPR